MSERNERTIRNQNLEARYGPDDFVNPDCYEPHNGKQKAFVVLDGGIVRAIVFAEYPAYNESDALDEAADSGKLGNPLTAEELKDYQTGVDGECCPEYDGRVAHLGNASEPYDQEVWDMWTVSASQFAEDPVLMTVDRVMERLKEREEEAEEEYDATDVYATDVYDPKWMAAIKERNNARDAVTLARLTIMVR